MCHEENSVEPGIFFNIPADEYMAIPALGSSAINTAAWESVAHALARRERPPTDALGTGTLAHIAILEPAKFQEDYIAAPTGPCQATSAKGAACSRSAEPGAKYCWQHGGREEAEAWRKSLPRNMKVASQDDIDAAKATAVGVRECLGDGVSILAGTRSEVTAIAWATIYPGASAPVFSTTRPPDEDGGISLLVKARFDAYNPETNTIVDVKGTTIPGGIDPQKFVSDKLRRTMLLQARQYTQIALALTGKEATWTWLAHEQQAPWGAHLFSPSESTLAKADTKLVEGLTRWHSYFTTGNKWDGWRLAIDVPPNVIRDY
jgi:hypothetical protein